MCSQLGRMHWLLARHGQDEAAGGRAEQGRVPSAHRGLVLVPLVGLKLLFTYS